MPVLNRHSIRHLLMILTIVANTIVVLTIGSNQFNFPPWIAEPLSTIEALFITDDDLQPSITKANFLVSKSNTTDLQHETVQPENISQHSELDLPTVGATCSIVMPTTQQKNIYTWIAEDGTRHLSDKPRLINRSTPVSVAAIIKPEAISVNYIGHSGSQIFRHKVNARVIANKELFAKITPKNLVKPISVNFRFFTTQPDYDAYQKRVAPSLKATNGFYISSINESVVMMKNSTQGANTAVHEAMHAINRHWFGNMSRWLNEGIAEYAEMHQVAHTKQSPWFGYIKRRSLMPLSSLFSVSEQDWGTHRMAMYATSWAYVAFLMENNRHTLTRLLMAENNNGCDVLNTKDIESISARSTLQLQRDFDQWLKSI